MDKWTLLSIISGVIFWTHVYKPPHNTKTLSILIGLYVLIYTTKDNNFRREIYNNINFFNYQIEYIYRNGTCLNIIHSLDKENEEKTWIPLLKFSPCKPEIIILCSQELWQDSLAPALAHSNHLKKIITPYETELTDRLEKHKNLHTYCLIKKPSS